jgi:hypothetical protein
MDEVMDEEQKRQTQTVLNVCLQGDSSVGLGWVGLLRSSPKVNAQVRE